MAETLGKKAAKRRQGRKGGVLVKKPCKLKEGLVALVKKPCKLKGDRVVLERTLVSV